MGTGHSCYPVVGDDSEDIVGVIHLHDVLTMTATSNSTVRSLARPALVLPTTLPLPKALTELTDTENQLACVIDEYGGFAGVITLEDIAEEIVGEITDEHDPTFRSNSLRGRTVGCRRRHTPRRGRTHHQPRLARR